MTPTEQVKMLREALKESVDRLGESRPDKGSMSDDLAKMWFERNRSLDQSRAALAATAEPAATCSCGFPRTAGYPRRACEACGRAATEPAKGDGILRTLDGKPMYLVGRTTDAPATAEPAPRSVHPQAAWSTAEPAPTYSADDLRKVAEAAHAAGKKDARDGWTTDLDAIIAKAVAK